jgi:ABC-type Na+ efflux pump permease subunit
MRKILTIMIREYKAMVGTKAFLLSILMVPVLMFTIGRVEGTSDYCFRRTR